MRASEFLPHKYPFVFLDTVEVIKEGKRGRGQKHITERDFYVNSEGVLPRIFMVEAMAQLSGIVSGRRGGAFLSAVKDFEFHGDVHAGQSLELESELEGEFGGMFVFHCKANAGGDPAATGRVVLKLGE